MALTPTNEMPLGTRAADFSLPEPLTGNTLSLAELQGDKGTVIAFICNHCPYVIHINEALVAVAKIYQQRGIRFIAISANSEQTHPQDGPEAMANIARNYPFPYLYDASQQVARAYHAACTPDIYLFDAGLSLVYHGQFDDSRPNTGKTADGETLRNAMDLLLDGQPPLREQPHGIGCNIKWHPARPADGR